MYLIPSDVKRDPARRWALPDRVFFACGACHVLAFAFLDTYSQHGFGALWIKPRAGFSGNHIIAVRGDEAFDYRGYSSRRHLCRGMRATAQRRRPGWDYCLIPLPLEVLVSETKSRRYPGLWLREPQQFLHDALPRAHRYLERFSAPTPPPS